MYVYCIQVGLYVHVYDRELSLTKRSNHISFPITDIIDTYGLRTIHGTMLVHVDSTGFDKLSESLKSYLVG